MTAGFQDGFSTPVISRIESIGGEQAGGGWEVGAGEDLKAS